MGLDFAGVTKDGAGTIGMAEIVNLKLARKRKARAEKEAAAEANRRKFGQTKAERDRQAAEKALADRRIDGHRRDDD